MFIFVSFLILSYLVGSIPSSYLAGKGFRGIDLRKHGSGNLGATNAFRVLGWKIGVFVLICDMLKGALPVFFFPGIIARWGEIAWDQGNIAILIGAASILGHVFTLFMRFKGGKGVATSMGVFLALVPVPFLMTLAVSLLIIAATHYVSAGSLTGAVLLPLLVIFFYPRRLPLILVSLLVGILLVIRHRPNIKRLIQGKENKLFP
ncbi:glycerol-3-phosphate 1-O-acyltransferase PlsY [Candidatus Sumerlaeota bacterium]|nr:glycerol-3-phosphate 1-O-acyltransferase PlsY [Candidatus Sumerlaeota bacterium]